MKLHALTLRALALGCSALVPLQAAAQTSFTVDGPETTTQTVSDGGTGTVTSNGSIAITTNNTNAILATGGTSTAPNTVNIHGAVSTTGIGSTAVSLGAYSDLALGADGTISATRDTSYGINAAINTTIEIAGKMTTETVAIYATDATSVAERVRVLVSDGGSIKTSGNESAHGISLGRYGNLETVAGSSITTTGSRSAGIYANGITTIANAGTLSTKYVGIYLDGTGNTLTQSGTLTATTDNAIGIFSKGGSNAITLAEAAKVVTTGTGAEAIVLGNSDTLSIAVGASVATAGEDAHGILARNNATISNAGAIATQGDGAYGISLYGSGSTLTHSGSISTEGESAYGVYSNDGTSTGNTITLEDGSTIATTGSQAHGVYLGQYSSLFVESGASISAQTESAHGIDAATHTTIEVAGAIESVAVGLFAADATNVAEGVNILVKDGGSIRTAGLTFTTGHGIYLGDYGKLELESGTSIATEGEESDGINTGTNVQIVNAGSIKTKRSGIRLGASSTLVQSGDITVAGPRSGSAAISSSGSNTITLTDSARILTKTSYSSGIVLGGSDVLSVASGATITTENNFSNGIDVSDNNDNSIDHAGTITTAGADADGIEVYGAGNSVVHSGSIVTSGLRGFGINVASGYSLSHNDVTVGAGGTIITTGTAAHGVFLSDYTELTIEGASTTAVAGSIRTGSSSDSTQGARADGIRANSYAQIDNTGDIVTYGTEAYGIRLLGLANSISNSGSITTKTANSHGISATSVSSATDANRITVEDGGSIETDGDDAYGVYLGDYNTLVVEAGGHIETNGEDAYGVYALSNTTIQNASTTIGTTDNGSHAINLSGIGNVVSQVGAITTKGNDAYGVYSADADDAASANTIAMLMGDSIKTSGTSSYGMRLGDFSELDIAYGASITTTGIDAHALFAYDDTTIVNAGTLTTNESGAYGISLNGVRNFVTHSGDIDTAGDQSIGIYSGPATSASDANRIYVSGNVTTSGDQAYAIYLDDYSELTVGPATTVMAKDADTAAIYATDNTTITTYGVISGTDYAIYLAGAGNTVNFMKGMTLKGRVFVGDENNTFVFGDGLNANITIDVDKGYEPLFVSGEDYVFCTPTYYVDEGISKSCTFASVDPTGFAILDELLEDATVPVFESVSRRLKRRDAIGDVAADQGMMVAPAGGGTSWREPVAWARAYGSYRDQAAYDDIAAFQHGLGGLVAGIDGNIDARTRAGVLIASTTGTASSSSVDIDWQTLFGGVYAGREVGADSILGLTVLAGGAWYQSDRSILDNTSTTGSETAEADYSASFVSPELSFKTSLGAAELRLAGRYAALFVGDYEEEGSSSDLSVGKRTVHLAGIGATVALPYRVNDRLTVEPYVGIEGRYASSGEVVGEVASLGQSVTLDGVGDKKVGRVIAGANATYRSKNSKLAWKLSLKGTLDSDGTTAVVASFGGELSF